MSAERWQEKKFYMKIINGIMRIGRKAGIDPA